ncbi:MAG: transporter [Lachnospiraceae bacterium]|nr:transporter [Lachnospiraceae bacterium]
MDKSSMELKKQPDRSEKKEKVTLKWFIFLHLSLILNSLTGVMCKKAATYEFKSLSFFFYYGLALFMMFVFALVWQQILRHMTLTFAFVNKPITVIYPLIWGTLFFNETVTPKMVVGALVILVGILIGVSGND